MSYLYRPALLSVLRWNSFTVWIFMVSIVLIYLTPGPLPSVLTFHLNPELDLGFLVAGRGVELARPERIKH